MAEKTAPGGRTYSVLSRRQIEGLIAEGRHIFILNQYVIKADGWLRYHPGGDLSIQHMVGRDATDEVTVYHSPETLESMNKYRIGRIEGPWKNFLPPVQGGRFRRIPSDGVEVEDEAEEEDEQDGASSENNSRPPSPVFDTTDDNNSKLRSRHGAKKPKSPASVSSVESLSDHEEPFDGMAHLDILTKKEIKLDVDLYPALDQATQDHICQRFRVLDERIKAEGLFDCNYWAYGIECIRYTSLFGLSMFFLHMGWYGTSGFFLGCCWHQLMFLVHDAAHISITHNFQIDSVISMTIASYIGGLSAGWWKRNHNIHHIVTNSPEHDPDIEHMPLFAVSHRFLGSLTSSYYKRVMAYDAAAKFLLRIQHHMYYIYLLFGRFNLYLNSWAYLLRGQAPKKGPAAWHWYFEMAGQVVFWYWYGYLIMYKSIDSTSGRWAFFMISHIVTSPVHLQIVLSHFAMSTADLGVHESFPQKMLRTTMDVDCPEWLDFFHGGLQFQAIHHLFPRVPRHNLRRAQKLVQEFCNEVGIPYALYGFVHGNERVIGRLAHVAQQAAILSKCQATLAQGHHHHH